MRILVVDDDPAGLLLLETLFSSRGYETASAVDGLDALAKARAGDFDAVITDVLMPHMDGYQLCREWKADPVLSPIPIVFYTATYTEPEDKDLAEGVGADLFITKPTDPMKVFAAVDSLLTRQAANEVEVRVPSVVEEAEVLREYSERVVHKLEHKIEELEAANARLEVVLGALDGEVKAKAALVVRLSEDVERRKEVEGRLQRTNELFSAVFDGSPLGIVATDRKGLVRAWNSTAERILGWTAQEVVGAPLPIGSGSGIERLVELAEQGGTCTAVEELRDKSGDVLATEVCAAPLRDTSGDFDGVVMLVADLTERAQVDELKQEFVQLVSHELRTPLTTIIGYGDLLAQMGRDMDFDQVDTLVHRIRNQGGLLAQLVDDLIGVLQIRAEGVRLDLVPADAGAIVRARAESIRPDDRHELRLEIPDEPVMLLCDPVQLGLAVKNVLANAIKYSPDGGTITVTVGRVGDDVRISIADQGLGIAPDEMSRVFDLFTQLDMSTTRRFGGLGMGLYLTKRIVEAHDGHIEVSSIPSVGSVFSLVLPAAPPDGPAPAA